MTVLKQYNSGTSTWETVVVGQPGEAGIVNGTVAPADTSVLWLDTADTASQVAIPAGGTAGQILAKTTGTDYATGWVDNTDNRNAIINGAFDFWQRGTSLTYTGGYPYLADRWRYAGDGSGFTRVISQQAFAPGTIPVSGFEGQFFYRFNQSVAGTGGTFSVVETTVEDVRNFAGQTVTFSFWAKADTARTIQAGISYQIFGSGGSANVFLTQPSVNITGSWARYSVTQSIPSISGKTIGANSNLIVGFGLPNNTVQTFDVWGVQLEAGSVATPFKRNAPSIQAELAACQRYYVRYITVDAYGHLPGTMRASSSTSAFGWLSLPVTMRTSPTSIEYSGTSTLQAYGATASSIGSFTLASSSPSVGAYTATINGTGMTVNTIYNLIGNNSTTAYLAFNAEL